tara:strand:+ start:641 stop:3478 length:2838 start_codon:yes stop_codon:yes gene_type:complete
MLRAWLVKGLFAWGFVFGLISIVPIYYWFAHYSFVVSSGVITELRETNHSPGRNLFGVVHTPILKFIKDLNPLSKIPGLPSVNLYVPQTSINELMFDLPKSQKTWQPASLMYPDGTLGNIKLKIRGDSPRNYLFEKKSWRIRTKKDELLRNARDYSYIVPRTYAMIEPMLSYEVAKQLGLETPNPRLVEVFLNDESNGIFLETSHLDEIFLRTSGHMPVTIFKSDRDLDVISNDGSPPMQNRKRWRKLTFNNRDGIYETPVLDLFLSSYNQAQYDKDAVRKLRQVVPLDKWVAYAAFDVLAHNFHSANTNARIIADDQKGTVVPIVWDPVFDAKLFQKLDERPENEPEIFDSWLALKDPNQPVDYLFAKCSYEVICFFQHYSDFRLALMKKIYSSILEDQIFANSHKFIKNNRDNFLNSLYRDTGRFDFLEKTSSLVKLTIKPNDTLKAFKLIEAGITNFERALIRDLQEMPDVSWSSNGRVLSLFINGPVPLSDMKLKTNKRARVAFFDRNSNGSIDEGDIEIPTHLSSGKLVLNASWLSNIGPDGNKPFVTTRFDILFLDHIEVSALTGKNALSGKEFSYKNFYPKEFRLPYEDNIPITSVTPKVVLFSGIVNIDQDTIIQEDVIIEAGTNIIIEKGKSLIFRGKVSVRGSEKQPVKVESSGEGAFGTFALQGKGASGSVIRQMNIENGSGGEVDGIKYLSMLSIHDAADVLIDGLSMNDNYEFDDMLHIVYGRNITLNNIYMSNANMDAIDIDLSTVMIAGLKVVNAGNDCLDLMSSSLTLEGGFLAGCSDKGLSVGEKSNLFMSNMVIKNSSIGIQVKDGSQVAAIYADFKNNQRHFSSFNKNWRYGNAPNLLQIEKSYVENAEEEPEISAGSKLILMDSTITNGIKASDRIEVSDSNDFISTRQIQKPKHLIAAYQFPAIKNVQLLGRRGASGEIASRRF